MPAHDRRAVPGASAPAGAVDLLPPPAPRAAEGAVSTDQAVALFGHSLLTGRSDLLTWAADCTARLLPHLRPEGQAKAERVLTIVRWSAQGLDVDALCRWAARDFMAGRANRSHAVSWLALAALEYTPRLVCASAGEAAGAVARAMGRGAGRGGDGDEAAARRAEAAETAWQRGHVVRLLRDGADPGRSPTRAQLGELLTRVPRAERLDVLRLLAATGPGATAPGAASPGGVPGSASPAG